MSTRDPVPLLHPRVRAHAGGLWTVWFGNGASALIEVDRDDRSAWPSSAHRWRVDGFELKATGVAYSRDNAMRAVWCHAARLSPPPPLEVDVLELARRVDRAEPSEAAAAIRKLLEQRTDRRWSVRVGKGSKRDEITIGGRGPLSAGEAALLAVVLAVDYVGPMGHTIHARIGHRSRAVLAIVGTPTPELEALRLAAVRMGKPLPYCMDQSATVH